MTFEAEVRQQNFFSSVDHFGVNNLDINSGLLCRRETQ